MNNKLVKVRWIDATKLEYDVTETMLVDKNLAQFITVGMVIVDNKQRLTIAGTVSNDWGETVYRDTLILPRQYIKEITELAEVT